jgi:hypothetical protein
MGFFSIPFFIKSRFFTFFFGIKSGKNRKFHITGEKIGKKTSKIVKNRHSQTHQTLKSGVKTRNFYASRVWVKISSILLGGIFFCTISIGKRNFWAEKHPFF